MQHKSSIKAVVKMAAFIIALSACSSAPEKVEPEAKPQSMPMAPAGVVNSVEVPVPIETLMQTKNSVTLLEDQLYGSKKLGTLGLLGDLKNCLRKKASAQWGGSGELLWMESIDRVSEKELEFAKEPVVDEKAQHTRFLVYKNILERRKSEYQAQIDECKLGLSNRQPDLSKSAQVKVTEAVKGGFDKIVVNQYVCGFVKKEASLKELMTELFAKGWLSLSDFKMDQNLMASNLMDSKKSTRDNGFMFNGWKLAFDKSSITVGDLLSGKSDAKLKSWSYPFIKDVPNHERCIETEGVWNP